MRWVLVIGAISAAVAVAAGAVGAHFVSDEAGRDLFRLASHYHITHSLALVLVALLFRAWKISGALFLLGILFFCGSLYAAALSDGVFSTRLAPLGGMAFILGWIVLAVEAFREFSGDQGSARGVSSRKRILFLCTGNSCRSQMAEGWAKAFFGPSFEVFSAGRKKQSLNSRAVKVMAECGVDISHHRSKSLDEFSNGMSFDVVVSVCDSAKEACPYYPGGKRLHRSFRDPPAITREFTTEEEILSVYREVRDEIRDFVKDLKTELEA